MKDGQKLLPKIRDTSFIQTSGLIPVNGSRALDKRGYWMIIEHNICYFTLKPYVVTPHLNHLNETAQRRGHIMF